MKLTIKAGSLAFRLSCWYAVSAFLVDVGYNDISLPRSCPQLRYGKTTSTLKEKSGVCRHCCASTLKSTQCNRR